MSGDICWHCDGSGERDFLSGARCYECNGTGWIEEEDEPWVNMTDEELAEYERKMDEIYRRDTEPEGKQ